MRSHARSHFNYTVGREDLLGIHLKRLFKSICYQLNIKIGLSLRNLELVTDAETIIESTVIEPRVKSYFEETFSVTGHLRPFSLESTLLKARTLNEKGRRS